MANSATSISDRSSGSINRNKPVVLFDCDIFEIGVRDLYLDSFTSLVEKTFRILYLNSKDNFYKKSIFLFNNKNGTHIDLIPKYCLAAFCFDIGSMCSRDVSRKLKLANIKRIAVISKLSIDPLMENAISFGYFDIVLVGELLSSLSVNNLILSLNQMQSIETIPDPLPNNVNYIKTDIDYGLVVDSCDLMDPRVEFQLLSLRKNGIIVEICNTLFVDKPLYNIGLIVMPQFSCNVSILRYVISSYHNGCRIFFNNETMILLGIGESYTNLSSIISIDKKNKLNQKSIFFDDNIFIGKMLKILN